jgi:carboxymethylenebutenolidase
MSAMSTYRKDTVAVEDGSFDLHVWTPEAGSGPGILLIQEIFGVGPYIKAVAGRLAAAGFTVGAPDVFWRFAPGWEARHDEAGLNGSLEKVQQLDVPKAIGDCVAALGHLKSLPETGGVAGLLGYCLGGTLAWGTAAHGDPACCVSYYGSGVPSMLGMISQVSCPTLFHFGSADPFLPMEGVEALISAVKELEGYTVNVEDAGHAFDNHEAEMFWNETAAESAWTKTMAFLNRHLR